MCTRIYCAVNTARYKPMQKILVIKHGALGDILLAMGAFRAVRQHHPDARITCMCRRQFVDLCKSCGYFDEVVVETMPKWHRPLEFLRIARFMRGFDRVYDFQNNDRTRIYFSLIPKHKRPAWNGVQDGASLQISDPDRSQKHAFQLLQDQLAVAGIHHVEPDNLSWVQARTDEYNLPEKYALIIAGCSPSHPEKRWPPDRFAAICQFLQSQGITPVLIGTEDERNAIDDIMHIVPDAVNLCGKTQFFDIPVLARHAVFTLGNDTGPMHMAALTGCPSLALYHGEGEKWTRSTIIGANTATLHGVKITDITAEDVKEKISSFLPWQEHVT